jgi:hypothetical protein
MVSAETASQVRSKISDDHTLPVSAYNPDGFESLETYAVLVAFEGPIAKSFADQAPRTSALPISVAWLSHSPQL